MQEKNKIAPNHRHKKHVRFPFKLRHKKPVETENQ